MEPILHVDDILAFLTANGIRWEQVEDGEPCWPLKGGGFAVVTLRDVERLMSIADPVVWSFLNLTEREGVQDPEDARKWMIHPGDPWKMFPVQTVMARARGNMIFECGAEVGKTRDIVNGSLWEADVASGGDSSLIAANSDTTLEEIWTEVEYQLTQNPGIGHGIKDKRLKPFRKFEFNNGFTLEGRICGHKGAQFRGAHVTRTVRADEVTMWKNPAQFTEMWRAAKPGARFRLYSTPDGDRFCQFFQLCQRAIPLGEPMPEGPKGETTPRFGKMNIKKMDLPYPFWSDRRAAEKREEYGGEESTGWITNVLGAWGSPEASVFPTALLTPCLKYLPHFRMVAAYSDREAGTFAVTAAQLARPPSSDREDILAQREVQISPSIGGRQMADEIMQWFPPTEDLVVPSLYCGIDPGSEQDPLECIFARKIDKRWQDFFRLHLRNATWPQIASIIMGLDHASQHKTIYSIDSGSAGMALVQQLCETEEHLTCPYCEHFVTLSERLSGRNFGSAIDEFDIDSGAPVLDPDRRDANRNPMPFRVSNKEFSTRVLERKLYRKELEIARDGGAGTARIAGPELMTNHTCLSVTGRGERRFKGTDDHLIDARRQLALAIVSGLDNTPALSSEVAKTVGGQRTAYGLFSGTGAEMGRGGVATGLGAAFGSKGTVRGIW